MKHSVLILVLSCFFSLKANSQILEIYEEAKDAINTASLEVIAGLEEATNIGKQEKTEVDEQKTKMLLEQKQTLEDLRKLTLDISEALKTYSTVQNAYRYLKHTVCLYSRLSEKFKNIRDSKGKQKFTASELVSLNNLMFRYVKSQKECFENIKLILDVGKTKMSEGQRIKLLYKEEQKMQENYARLKRFDNLFEKERIL